jgi:hypothetical protein
MSLSGLGNLILAFFVGLDQLFFMALTFLIGGYFLYGGIRLVMIWREGVRVDYREDSLLSHG